MRKTYLSVILLIAACLIAYANALFNGFVWDDSSLIVNNEFIKKFSHLLRVFDVDFWEPSYKGFKTKFYRPVITASFIIDYAVWRLSPLGYHLTNIIFHSGVTLLAYGICRYFLSGAGALLAGIVFAVHPVHTESVSFICGRTDSIAAVFLFASFLLFIYEMHSRQPDDTRSLITFSGLVLFLLSLYAKEASVVGIPVIMCIWWYFRPIHKRGYQDLMIKTVFLCICLVMYMAVRGKVYAGSEPLKHEYPGGTFLNTMLTMPKIFFLYIKSLFVPTGLCIEYSPYVVTKVLSPMFWMPAIGVAAAGITGLIGVIRRYRPWCFGIVFFFIGLAPVSNIISVGLFMADRFLYIPSLGFCMVAGYCGALILGWRTVYRRSASYAVLTVITCMVILTVVRTFYWHNSARLWFRTLHTNPMSYRAYGSIAQILEHQGKIDDAIAAVKNGLMLKPNDHRLLGSLAILYMRKKEYKQALYYFTQSLKCEPRDYKPYANMFIMYSEMGKVDEAVYSINRAIELNPSNILLHFYKAEYCFKQGQIQPALDEYAAILRLDPNNIDALTALASLYFDVLEDYQPAAPLYKRIMELQPDNIEAYKRYITCNDKLLIQRE